MGTNEETGISSGKYFLKILPFAVALGFIIALAETTVIAVLAFISIKSGISSAIYLIAGFWPTMAFAILIGFLVNTPIITILLYLGIKSLLKLKPDANKYLLAAYLIAVNIIVMTALIYILTGSLGGDSIFYPTKLLAIPLAAKLYKRKEQGANVKKTLCKILGLAIASLLVLSIFAAFFSTQKRIETYSSNNIEFQYSIGSGWGLLDARDLKGIVEMSDENWNTLIVLSNEDGKEAIAVMKGKMPWGNPANIDLRLMPQEWINLMVHGESKTGVVERNGWPWHLTTIDKPERKVVFAYTACRFDIVLLTAASETKTSEFEEKASEIMNSFKCKAKTYFKQPVQNPFKNCKLKETCKETIAARISLMEQCLNHIKPMLPEETPYAIDFNLMQSELRYFQEQGTEESSCGMAAFYLQRCYKAIQEHNIEGVENIEQEIAAALLEDAKIDERRIYDPREDSLGTYGLEYAKETYSLIGAQQEIIELGNYMLAYFKTEGFFDYLQDANTLYTEAGLSPDEIQQIAPEIKAYEEGLKKQQSLHPQGAIEKEELEALTDEAARIQRMEVEGRDLNFQKMMEEKWKSQYDCSEGA